MTDIYEGYLSPRERKEAIADAKLDALFERCYMMYEMVQLRYEQNVREAELKVLAEGGTYDDLTYLIEEASEEANDKKKGLISTIIDGIVNLFKQIGESIRKLFVKDGEEVEADEGIMSGVNTFDKMFAVVERTFSGGIVQGFLRTAGIVEGCKQMWNLFTSIPMATGKMRKYASDGVNKAKEILAKICDWIAEKTSADKAEVEKMEKEEPAKLNEDKGEGWSLRRVFDFFKDIGKKVREHVNSLAKSLGDKLRGDDSGGDDTKKAIKDDIQYAKGGWVKGSDGKYTKDESKKPGSPDEYINSDRYKSILTNAGVAEGDARNEYDEYAKNTWANEKVKPKDPTQDNNNDTQSTQDNNNNTQSTPSIKKKDGTELGPRMLKKYNELKDAYDKKASGPHRSEAMALNNFIRSNNLDVPTVESFLDDYIDELEDTIYENTMTEYEVHSLISAIDAIF